MSPKKQAGSRGQQRWSDYREGLAGAADVALGEANDEAALNAESPPETPSPATGLREIVEQERQRQATETTKPPPKRPSRKPFPTSLKRVDLVISVPDAERPCPDCGNERRIIGHDVTEMLDLVPAKVMVQRQHREKLVCDACETPAVPNGRKPQDQFSISATRGACLRGASWTEVSSLRLEKTRATRRPEVHRSTFSGTSATTTIVYHASLAVRVAPAQREAGRDSSGHL
jgi:transposase